MQLIRSYFALYGIYLSEEKQSQSTSVTCPRRQKDSVSAMMTETSSLFFIQTVHNQIYEKKINYSTHQYFRRCIYTSSNNYGLGCGFFITAQQPLLCLFGAVKYVFNEAEFRKDKEQTAAYPFSCNIFRTVLHRHFNDFFSWWSICHWSLEVQFGGLFNVLRDSQIL